MNCVLASYRRQLTGLLSEQLGQLLGCDLHLLLRLLDLHLAVAGLVIDEVVCEGEGAKSC